MLNAGKITSVSYSAFDPVHDPSSSICPPRVIHQILAVMGFACVPFGATIFQRYESGYHSLSVNYKNKFSQKSGGERT
ncbi:MAG: hypothetical protein PHZ02_17565 [Desulfocapsaceae bacterium]|nr:hypothetical protein [Desulfocapsaceae bacterium]